MKQLTFLVPEYKQVEINGNVFNILKADKDVLLRAAKLREEYSGLAEKKGELGVEDIEKIIAGVQDVINCVEEVLGEGSVEKITAGRPLGIVKAFELMTLVCKAAIEEYNDGVKENYGE
jgi:hypothetical protein